MEIMMVGLDCKTTPVEIREKLSFVGTRLTGALTALVEQPFISEAVILSTCNRMEVYILSEHSQQANMQAEMQRFLSEYHDVHPDEFSHNLYYFSGRAAANHLFEVASGIQSMVLGEAQIQGQVREAIDIGRKEGAAGRVMDALFRAAISTGKRARTETAIGENGVSVSFTAVELLKRELGSLENKTALIVGNGQTAKLTAQVLLTSGVNDLIILSRDRDKGRDLALLLGTDPYKVFNFCEREEALRLADVVVCSTSAPHPIIHQAHVKAAVAKRPDRPLYMVDIAVPRDIEPEVNNVEGVKVWDIDDIKKLVDENLDKRRSEVHRVRHIVLEELEDFMAWMGALAVVPTITTLRRHADTIRRVELERLRHSFGELTERQVNLLDELTNRIVNKLLHEPTMRLKEIAGGNDAGRYAEVVRHLFSLQGISHETN
jgi:glutamyl-tRNA reductase